MVKGHHSSKLGFEVYYYDCWIKIMNKPDQHVIQAHI